MILPVPIQAIDVVDIKLMIFVNLANQWSIPSWHASSPEPVVVTTLRRCCQLLPVRRRVEFKLACLVRQALCHQMPTYLADDIHLVSKGNRRSLRSSSDNMCAVPRTHNPMEISLTTCTFVCIVPQILVSQPGFPYGLLGSHFSRNEPGCL